MKTLKYVAAFVVLSVIWWIVGGVHLDYLRHTGPTKALEMGCKKIVSQGYERSVFFGFGGRFWYQCEINGLLYQFALTRRINSPEMQVYSLQQMSFPFPPAQK